MLIRQTEHARLCGEMARSWGNEHFEPVEPLERVAWAAAEHDNGWAEWEEAPRLNPETRRPCTYTDIPIDQHQEIYRRGIGRAIAPDRYAGLLVSLHGSLLYSRFRSGQPGGQDFLEGQRSGQRRVGGEKEGGVGGGWGRGGRAERVLGSCGGEPRLSTNRDLVFGWDTLSLFL